MIKDSQHTLELLSQALDILRGNTSSAEAWDIIISILFVHFAEKQFDKVNFAQNQEVTSLIDAQRLGIYYVPDSARISAINIEADTLEVWQNFVQTLTQFAFVNDLEHVLPSFHGVTPAIFVPLFQSLQKIESLDSNSLVDMYRHIMNISKGEFITPPAIAELMIQLVSPIKGQAIGDPAVGSGTLLLTASRLSSDDLSLYGADINAHALLFARLQALVNNVQHIEFKHGNSLNIWQSSPGDSSQIFSPSSLDVIVTNPPFGIRIEDEELLSSFARHGGIPRISGKNQLQIEVLFLNLCVDILKPGGKLAILLPEGFLQSSSLNYARMWLLKKMKVKAIVTLPIASLPYVGISTAVLVLEKMVDESKELDDYPIYMAQIDKLDEEIEPIVTRFNQEVGW